MKKYYNIPDGFYVAQLLLPMLVIFSIIMFIIKKDNFPVVLLSVGFMLSIWLTVYYGKRFNYIIFDEDKFKIKVCFFKKNGEHPYDDVKKVVIEGLNVHCGLSNIFLHFEDKKDIVRFYSNKNLIIEVIRRFPDRISIEGNYVRHQIEKIKKEMDNK